MYPTVSDCWNSFHQSRAITFYAESVAQIDDDTYEKMWDQAVKYSRKTYYVTETDADGVPVAGSASFAYTVSVDKTSVTLSGDHSEEAAVITNARTEPPGEPVIPENPDTPPTQNSVRTGDETPLGLYLGIFAGSAVMLVVLLVFFVRRRRKTR